jgi:hypothetical protein
MSQNWQSFGMSAFTAARKGSLLFALLFAALLFGCATPPYPKAP